MEISEMGRGFSLTVYNPKNPLPILNLMDYCHTVSKSLRGIKTGEDLVCGVLLAFHNVVSLHSAHQRHPSFTGEIKKGVPSIFYMVYKSSELEIWQV